MVAADVFDNVLRSGASSTPEALDLAPSQPGFVVVIPDLLDHAECAALISAGDAVGWEPATAADRTPRKNEAYLDRDALHFKSPRFETELWRRLLPYLPPVGDRAPVGLHADGPRGEAGQCRLYRYTASQRFGKHVDVSRRGARTDEETEYTLLVYLSSEGELPPGRTGKSASRADGGDSRPLAGGDTIFWASARKELCRVSPRAGLALLHAHGRRCLVHEGEEVQKGAKYVLRADVLYAPSSTSRPAAPAALTGAGAGATTPRAAVRQQDVGKGASR
ncbi:hypothetical protein KFE25_002276 [Diacronema lutheri]|uniref:Prolyl 4-hydroxylase alpha subunit domain-containing protein n=1 Tax=Diacronema lutheri TaxID=2081491 RepID=A0A8J6C065_DIALT|nr:hypothetical protein KFE25_002276 [Diacronema lutheri]